jgi:UDP-glucose 6-dehydrogenase
VILVAGYGCEGRAIYRVFSSNFAMSFVDPKYSDKTISDYDEIHALIYCVPFEQQNGVQDIAKLQKTLDQIPVSTPVLIRSTISLNAWRMIKTQYPEHQIAYSPSFLRKALHDHDMKNLTEVIIAGKSVDYWQSMFSAKYRDLKIYTKYTVEEAITIKHFRTAFLATKLSFFNQVFDFCEQAGMAYDNIRAGVTADVRIGESHSFIDRDFTRFWRNTGMNNEIHNLLLQAQQLDVDLTVISSARDYNQQG